jgi:ABC-2 type transport system permease protein
MQVVGNLLPFTHGVEAVRQAADGAGIGQVGWLIGIEALVGIAYAVAAFALFRFLETSSRRNATLEVR